VSEQLIEKTYTYQPTDEEGRPIGGKQVIKYTTQDELVDKLRTQNTLLIRKLRQETKKGRLGIGEDEVVPENAQRFSDPLEFNPRELTQDERYDISRRLLDPTTSAEAASALVEAQLGAPLSQIGRTMQTIQQDNISLRAKVEANAFVAENPDYYKCQENFEALASWIVRYNLAPVKDNFQKAYDTLKAQGILIEGAALPPEPVAPVEPVVVPVEPVVVEPVPVVPVVRIPTGLTREEASDSGVLVKTGSDITYELTVGGQKRVLTGLAAINAMPGEEYKRRLLTDREFGKKVEKLETEARKPRG
jgi:hypothetical protein